MGGRGLDLGPVHGVADQVPLMVDHGQVVGVGAGTWHAPAVTFGPNAEASYLRAFEGC